LPPPRPAQDEWGMYDPDQCGVTVVLERVRRLAAPDPQDDDHKRPSAIIRR